MAERSGRQLKDGPRDVAAYSVGEASRYVRIPAPTLRTWVDGQSYNEQSKRSPFFRLLQAPEYNPTRLSFNNLIEAYTLRALKNKARNIHWSGT